MPTWNTTNNSIAYTTNVIITAKDTLAGLGIDVSNVCDAKSIEAGVNKVLNDWLEELKRSVDNISFEMVGNFLTTLAALLTQLLTSAAASYTNLFLLEILAGNLLNSIITAVTFALALLPGAEMILQYYLVNSLNRDLSRRIKLGSILDKEFSQLIELFTSFYNLFDLEDDLKYADLKKALANIRRAETIIGKEASKNFYGDKPITLDNLDAADNYLENAINNLTHQNYDIVNTYIKQVNQEFGIGANVPKGLDIKAWINYFDKIQPFVALNFFTYDKQPGEEGYEEEVNAKAARYNQFISAMMRVMPPILQRLVLNATVKKSSNVIFERIPVWANNISLLKELKGFLDNTVSVSDKFLNTYLNQTQTKTHVPALFKDPATKDITWRNITSKIRIEEAGVLLFPSYWDYIKGVGGLLQNILFPVLDILKGVDSEIDEAINSRQLNLTELSVKQFLWVEQISSARGLLSTIINSTEIQNTYGGFNVDPVQVFNSTVEANEAMGRLQQIIRENSYDFKTQTPKTQPADVVYDTAQKYLGNLVANIYIVVNPGAAKNLISGLQAMRVAVREQRKQDRREASACAEFLGAVEANPLFIAAKPYLDQLLNDLSKTPLGAGIAKQILEGDLSSIISILEGHHLATEIVELINCENQKTEQNIDPSIFGLDENTEVETTNRIERSLSQHRDQQNMIINTIPGIIELVEQA